MHPRCTRCVVGQDGQHEIAAWTAILGWWRCGSWPHHCECRRCAQGDVQVLDDEPFRASHKTTLATRGAHLCTAAGQQRAPDVVVHSPPPTATQQALKHLSQESDNTPIPYGWPARSGASDVHKLIKVDAVDQRVLGDLSCQTRQQEASTRRRERAPCAH